MLWRIIFPLLYFPSSLLIWPSNSIGNINNRQWIVGVDSTRPMSTEWLSYAPHRQLLYFNPEHINIEKPFVNKMSVINMLPSMDVSPAPLSQLKITRYHQWTLSSTQKDLSYQDYCRLEKTMVFILKTYLQQKKLFIIFIPYQWLTPDLLPSYFSIQEKEKIYTLGPLLTSNYAFPVCDSVYMELKDLSHNSF